MAAPLEGASSFHQAITAALRIPSVGRKPMPSMTRSSKLCA
jgi:hypothetical protein